MKSVLIIDTPLGCVDCPCSTLANGPQLNCWSAYCDVCGEFNNEIVTKPEWCPLKPMAEYEEIMERIHRLEREYFE